MSTRVSQPENFDSTAKLMLEALAKASAELEKSVTAFTEQLISYNESIQKSLEEELRSVNSRLDGVIRNNLDELVHSKHVLMKRLLEAEREELNTLSDAGRQVRVALSGNAQQIEEKIEQFIDNQIKELKEFLKEPQSQIESNAGDATRELGQHKHDASERIKSRQDEFRKQLSDKVAELERSIKSETQTAREAVAAVGESWTNKLKDERESFCEELQKTCEKTLTEMDSVDNEGNLALEQAEQEDKTTLEHVGKQWKYQITEHADSFNKLIGSLSSVLKENFETKLANVSDQVRQEITMLSEQAHEKIAATRNELEIELRDMEKEYVHQLEGTLRKLEAIISEHANDKRNSGLARQHKEQKLRDQMQSHLKRWGASLVDSIKDSATALENEFDRATDGFHIRIEGARTSAIEALERESKLMQKDIERTLKEFQRELGDEEAQIGKIEHAGQDAVVTVIACRKAMLSFQGE